MPNFCVAPNCTKKSTQTDLAFFRFPRDVKRCHEWVENCRRADLLAKTPDQLNKHYRLCAAHFDPSMICKTGPFRTVLKDSAVPTIFDFSGQNKKLHKNRKRVKVLTEEEVRDIKERRLEEEAEANKEDEDVEDMEQDAAPQLSPEEQELREYLRSLFEILLLLGKQGIPLIGHTVTAPLSSSAEKLREAGGDAAAAAAVVVVEGNQDKTSVANNGNRTGPAPPPPPPTLPPPPPTTFTPLSNFQALVEFRISAGDEALRRRFEGAATNSETCPPETLRNMLDVAAACIREDLLRDVQLYSLIAGEPAEMASSSDFAGRESGGGREVLLPIFARFVDVSAAVAAGHGGPREELLGFVPLECDGDTLAERLLAFVTEACGLDADKCRGFAYDCGGGGARHALRMRTAAERISERHPAAVRTLWSGCGLNTLLAESAGTPGTQVVVATLSRVDALLRSSPALRLELERAVAASFRDDEEMCRELLAACRRGRWGRRHNAFQLTSDLLEPLKLCLESVCDSGHDQRWSERVARDCLALAETLNDFEFLAALVVLKNVLSFTRAFGRNLQGGAMDVHLATSSVTAVLHSLVEVADNIDVYHEFWFEEAVLVAQSLGIPVRVPLRHLRKCAGTGAEPQPEGYYKEHLTVPVVSYVIAELNELFSETHLKVLRCLSLIPAVMGQLKFAADVAEETAVAEVYRRDLPSPDTLATELQCWRVKWKHRSKGVPLPASVAETLRLADVKFFPNLDALLGALWNLPILSPDEGPPPEKKKTVTAAAPASQQKPQEETTTTTPAAEAETEVAVNDDDDDNDDDAGDDDGAGDHGEGGCGGTARSRLQAYLRDTPVRHRSSWLALVYANMDARHDPDRMVEAYLKLYPDSS
ncbi:52 kDa repressor of the inhibitor of the protein kinase-like [Sardina pilchardus]|uniref:52 kDa repressor of the inhibitor of the protein kinase-like n=1 Tax=Sardina pilchardus TaxID=27697 RepID=UPI002E1495AE